MKYFRNIISVFAAFILLTGGNFAYALAHSDCILVDEGYITCEMECCKKNPCIEDFKDIPVIKDNSKSCCQLHIEQTVEQDITMPVVTKTADISKFIFSEHELNLTSIDIVGSPQVIHKFKTSNIFLTVSNLRI
ncbi:MAG: hypothetical protein IT280_05125 [Ignavibacteria bacterium]|nr:hypothetical protein [Ignavibacteria bacterium]